MILQNISLVNWGMGTTIIVIFGVFCVVLSLLIYSMAQSGKNKKE